MKLDIAVDTAKITGDVAAAGTALGTVLQLLPPIAAIFTIIWTTMRIYEMIRGEKFSQTPLGQKIRNKLKLKKDEQ